MQQEQQQKLRPKRIKTEQYNMLAVKPQQFLPITVGPLEVKIVQL